MENQYQRLEYFLYYNSNTFKIFYTPFPRSFVSSLASFWVAYYYGNKSLMKQKNYKIVPKRIVAMDGNEAKLA